MAKVRLKKNNVIKLLIGVVLAGMLSTPIRLFGAQFSNINEEETYDKCGLEPIDVIEISSLDEDTFLFTVNENDLPQKYSVPDEDYWRNFSSRFYFDQMPADVKGLWNQLEQACVLVAVSNTDCSSVSIQLESLENMSRQEIVNFLSMFKYSNPQYYFLSNKMFINYNDGNAYVGIYLYEDFKNGEARWKATDLFTSKLDEWIAEIQTGKYDEDKVKLAHDLVAGNTVYGYGTFDQSAYSMVCEGVTVCAGYSAAFQMLLNAVGIEAAEVTSDSHGWNIVRIHGYWYNVDVTWDDSYSIIYNYYNKSDVTFRANTVMHNPEDLWEGLLPEMKYDSSSADGYTYRQAYISDGDYDYFILNDNSLLGVCQVKAVGIVGNAQDIIPENVVYNDKLYIVVNADAASQAVNGLGQGDDGEWYYYRHGIVDNSYTGMAQNEYGWWYIINGQLDWDYTGMACNEYGWWYYRNGQLDWDYTGMACNEYGWWYYQNGQLDWNYTGMACNEYGWWYYRNGQLDWNYTGMAWNEYGWWYYSDGRLDWTYTGWGENQYGQWYFYNGRIVYD